MTFNQPPPLRDYWSCRSYVFEVCLISKHCIERLDGSPKPSCHAGPRTFSISSVDEVRADAPGRSNAKGRPLPLLVFALDEESVVIIKSVPAELTPRSSPCSLWRGRFASGRPTKFEARPGQPIGGVSPSNWPGDLPVYIDDSLASTSESGPLRTPNAVFATSFDECGH